MHQAPSVPPSQPAQPGSQGLGSTPRDSQPTLVRGPPLDSLHFCSQKNHTTTPCLLEKALHCSDLQQELGGRVLRGPRVLTINIMDRNLRLNHRYIPV